MVNKSITQRLDKALTPLKTHTLKNTLVTEIDALKTYNSLNASNPVNSPFF